MHYFSIFITNLKQTQSTTFARLEEKRNVLANLVIIFENFHKKIGKNALF